MLFFGHFSHAPNVDAVEYLCREIAPLVWSKLPEVLITIAGADPPRAFDRHVGDRVRVLGWVEDLDAVIDGSRVMIAPLRFGAGVKGKVALAMARGLPVVTTAVGAEGLGLTSEESVLIGGSSRELADQCLRLLNDAPLWERISKRERAIAVERLTVESAAPALRAVLGMATHGQAT
jgi:glycosyltransferase involved in cell wall biosynthesis